MAEEGYVGLGFHYHGGSGQQQQQQQQQHHGSHQPTPTPTTSVADSLMRSYMDQCLEYHQRREQGQETETPFQPQQQQPQPSAFVPAQQPRDATNVANMSEADRLESHKREEEERSRKVETARAIALKFHERHRRQQQSEAPSLPSVISIIPSSAHPTPSECRTKRERHAEIHRIRLHRAMLKNFEYVARRDEEGMREHAAELERRKLMSDNIAREAELNLERRKEAASEGAAKGAKSKSGIGTGSRRHIERQKRRDGHSASKGRKDMSHSVYVTGLPPDGSVTDSELRQLFGCYGTVRRAVMYTDKKTGRLKGDGLVAYEPPQRSSSSKDEGDTMLVRDVCSQLNGVELPCGARLGVEPADPNYSKSSNKSKQSEPRSKFEESKSESRKGAEMLKAGTRGSGRSKGNGDHGEGVANGSLAGAGDGYYGPASASSADGGNGKKSESSSARRAATASAAEMRAEGAGDGEDDDEDLDDFFASLT